MTQPRKEQVKNLKTKYTRFNGVGTLSLGGGPVQTITNTVLEAFYDNLLAATKTGGVGGAESSAPAMLYGGSGPFTLAAGNTFNLTIANVAGGVPIAITLQAGDIVNLGGVPVVTTARMADRINQAVFGFGVTSAVAANVDGQLVLTSAGTSGVQTGDSAVITVTEVTPGILNVLGFSSTSAASAQGTTAPRRGLVTVSSDGLGGFVQLRKVDATVSDAVNSVAINAVAGEFIPEFAHGQPVYARLRAFPGPVVNGRNLKLSYFRTGPMRPQVVTSSGVNKANFASLLGADTVAVGLNFGNGQSLNFNVSFSGITTVQNVIDKFNQALRDASLLATDNEVDATLPHVIFKLGGPYRFSESPSTTDSFFFSLNGLAPLHFNPPLGRYTSNELETYLGGLIASYGGLQGQAFSYNAPDGSIRVGMRSENTNPAVSQIRIYPGNPGGSTPGQYMDTLDMLGVTPGVYKGATMAALYGNDEIVLYCPSALAGSTLTISGGASTMAKLGLPSGVNAVATVGTQPTVAPTSHALLPEMMEFHEERDDYDSVVQDFDNKSPYSALKPQDGVSNNALSQLLGADGKVNPSLIPHVFQTLGLDRLFLGQRMVGEDIVRTLLTPKISASHNFGSGHANLLFESLSESSSLADRNNLRVYTQDSHVFITNYCKIVDGLGSAGAFTRDTQASDGVATRDSTLIWVDMANGTVRHSFRRSTETSPWGIDDWHSTVQLDPKSTLPEQDLVRIGGGLDANTTDAAKPRIGLVAPNILITLLQEFRGPEGARIRLYSKIGEDNEGDVTGESFFFMTVNARWDGSNWNKDALGTRSTHLEFGSDVFKLQHKVESNNAPWGDGDWDWEDFSVSFHDSFQAFVGGTLSVGGNLANQPDSPAIRGFRWVDAGNKRTMLFESQSAGPFANVPIRIFMLTGSSVLGQGFEFTYNCNWDPALQRWYPDDFAQKSYSWVMATDRFWLLSRDVLGIEWTEDPVTGWSNYSVLDHLTNFRGYTVKDGVFRVDSAGSVSNPTPATAVRANSVYAKSMIKAWGKIRGDGPSITQVSLLDGFNCNFTGYDGGAGAYAASFATVMLNTHYAVQFSGRASNGGNPPVEPGSYFVWSGSKIHLYSAVLIGQANYGFSYYPLTATNGTPNSFIGDIRGHFMYFTVVGAQ